MLNLKLIKVLSMFSYFLNEINRCNLKKYHCKTSSNNSSSFIGRMVAVLDTPVNRNKMILCLQIRYTMFIKTLNTKPFVFTEEDIKYQ